MHGVQIMKLNDNKSYIEVRAQLRKFMEANYDIRGRFIDKGEYTEELPIDNTYLPGTTLAQKTKIMDNRLLEYDKDQLLWARQKREIYGLLLSMLSRAGSEAIERDPGYPAAYEAADPLLLWNIIVKTHSGGDSHHTQLELQYAAQEKVHRIYQGEHLGLLEYKDLYEMAIKAMIQSGVEHMPDEQFLALNFFKKADKKRYGDLMTQKENEGSNGNDTYPKTVQSAFQMLDNFKPLHRYRESSSSSSKTQTAFVSIAELKKTSRCHNCDEIGHWARECKKPKVKKYGQSPHH